MRTKLLAGLFGFFVALSSASVWAQAKPPLEKLRFVYSAIGGSQSSVWIPYEAGIFRKHGLDIEMLYVGGGGRAAQVVQSGEVPIGIFTGGAVINSNLAGGDLVVVASGMNVIPFSLMVRPEIRQIEELKGNRHKPFRLRDRLRSLLLGGEMAHKARAGFRRNSDGGHARDDGGPEEPRT